MLLATFKLNLFNSMGLCVVRLKCRDSPSLIRTTNEHSAGVTQQVQQLSWRTWIGEHFQSRPCFRLICTSCLLCSSLAISNRIRKIIRILSVQVVSICSLDLSLNRTWGTQSEGIGCIFHPAHCTDTGKLYIFLVSVVLLESSD